MVLLSLCFWKIGCAHRTKNAESRLDENCHRYLIAPVFHRDEIAADYIWEQWEKLARAKLNFCDTIIDQYTTKNTFERARLYFGEVKDFYDINETALESLVEQTGATDVLILKYRVEKDHIYIYATEHNVLSNLTEKESQFADEFKVARKADDPFKVTKIPPWMMTSFRFFPNTISTGLGSLFVNNSRSDVEIVKEESKDELPDIISGTSIYFIEHPAGFSRWDYSFTLSPYGNFNLLNTRYHLVKKCERDCSEEPMQEPEEYNLKILVVYGTYDVSFSGYTPLGTFIFGLGFGPATYYYRDDYTSNYGIRFLTKFSMGYRAFVARNVYLYMSYQSLTFTEEVLSNPLFRLNSIGSISLGAGYYFPYMRVLTRRLVNKLM
jgi:hypothetical protein